MADDAPPVALTAYDALWYVMAEGIERITGCSTDRARLACRVSIDQHQNEEADTESLKGLFDDAVRIASCPDWPACSCNPSWPNDLGGAQHGNDQ